MADSDSPVTWESLESYISGYTGIIKVKRLVHIAEQLEALRIPAYLLALKTLEEDSLDTATYEDIVQKLQSLDSTLIVDTTWKKDASKKADMMTDKLEQELKAYKNNLIKESIRMGQQDIANHYIKTGDLEGALKALFRNRDYCTTPLHTFQVNMGIIGLSIFLGQWQQVQSYVLKVENMDAQVKERPSAQEHLHVASALALLSQEKFKEAGEKFQAVDAAIGSSWSSVITMNDIANFTSLLALATYSREEVLKLSESAAFKPFLELELPAREALTAFHRSRYAECFRLIDSIKGNMKADIFFSSHVETIYGLIRERSILQFTSAFNNVSLQRMASVFSLSVTQIEDSLVALITSGKLPNTRIDLKQGLLVYEGNALRDNVYEKAARVSANYKEEIERALFHLAVTKAGLLVEPAKTASANSRSLRYGDALVMLHEEQDDSDMMEVG